MSSIFVPLTLNLLPSTSILEQCFDELFKATYLFRNTSSGLSSEQIKTRKLALKLIVCCLLKGTNMVSERYCSRTIEPNSFTGIGFSRHTFDVVVNRLEEYGYIRFERGERGPKKRFLSRNYLRLKLVKFFDKHGINNGNLRDNIQRYVPEDFVGKTYVEVRTGSWRLYKSRIKLKGRKVSNHRFRKNKKFIEQMKRMEEVNDFLFQFELKLPNGGSFNGLRRIFGKYKDECYAFDQGGRLYGQYGDDYQQLPKGKRAEAVINCEPVTEVDIHGSFLTIAHCLRGVPFPDITDLYEIEGVHRDIIKNWINLTLTDTKPRAKWPSDTKKQLIEDGLAPHAAGFYSGPILKHYPFLATMDETNHGWGTLQYIESEIMLMTMEALRKSGIPAYPVHDSLMVPRRHRQRCVDLLSECFRETTGITPILK